MESLADEVLAHEGAVGVGRIDEVDAEVDRLPHDSDGDVMIRRVAPDAGTGDAHGAEAQAIDRQGIGRTQGEGAGGMHGLGHALIVACPTGTIVL